MANKILNTPGGQGQLPAGKVFVGAKNNNGTVVNGFTNKLFVFDLENIPDPLNPLNLPINTIRVKFKSGYTPTMGDTQTLVDSTNNVWDIEEDSNDWSWLFTSCTDLLEVLGGNTKNVTCMDRMFYNCESLTTVENFSMENVVFVTSHQDFAMFQGCSSLTTVPNFYFPKLTIISEAFYGCTSLRTIPKFETAHVISMYNMFAYSSIETVPLLDMKNVTNCNYMFHDCTSLKHIPLFNLSSANVVYDMFNGCVNVESGALDLYNSIKNDPPTDHVRMFYNCGRDTQTGSAELAQIPTGWK